MSEARALLEVRDAVVRWGSRHAVDGANLTVKAGERLGLVGASGSGKTTLVQAIVGLVPLAGGQIIFDGLGLSPMPAKARAPLGRRVQLVFQEAARSLNPRWKVSELVAEPLRVHGQWSAEGPERVEQMLTRLGLAPDCFERVASALSTGQRQRVALARALVGKPELLILDETLSGLDATVQNELLRLLAELQREWTMSVVLVAHELSLVRAWASRVCVMHAGRVVEDGHCAHIFSAPVHEATRALVDAVARLAPEVGKA
jgi:ABC-type glutathione transport system ATPase component